MSDVSAVVSTQTTAPTARPDPGEEGRAAREERERLEAAVRLAEEERLLREAAEPDKGSRVSAVV